MCAMKSNACTYESAPATATDDMICRDWDENQNECCVRLNKDECKAEREHRRLDNSECPVVPTPEPTPAPAVEGVSLEEFNALKAQVDALKAWKSTVCVDFSRNEDGSCKLSTAG